MPTAQVTPEKGDPFSAEIANLTPTSVFIQTERAFQFRDALQIDMLGVTLRAEVVYVSKTPPVGIGVVFQPSSDQRARIEAEIARKPEATKPPEPPPAVSAPAPRTEGWTGGPNATGWGMQPGMPPGMQGGMQPGMQGGMQPGMQGGMQPGMQGGMQPGMQGGMQPGMVMPGMTHPGMMQPSMVPGMPGLPPWASSGMVPGMPSQRPQSYGANPSMAPGFPMRMPNMPPPWPGAMPPADFAQGPSAATTTRPAPFVPPMMTPAPGPLPTTYRPNQTGEFQPYSTGTIPGLSPQYPSPLQTPPNDLPAIISSPSITAPLSASMSQAIPPMTPASSGEMPAVPYPGSGLPGLADPFGMPMSTTQSFGPAGFPAISPQFPGSMSALVAELEASLGGVAPMPPIPPAPIAPPVSAPSAGRDTLAAPPPPSGAPDAAPAIRAPSTPTFLEAASDGAVQADSPLDAFAVAATLLSGRSPVVRAGQPLSKVKVVHKDIVLELNASTLGPGYLALTGDTAAVRQAAAALLPLLDPSAFGPDPEALAAVLNEPPKLGDDGVTVAFDSLPHFAAQYKSTISRGALTVRSPSIAIGTKRELKLVIPTIDLPLAFECMVAFVGDGTVGFAIDRFTEVKPGLEEIARKKEPERRAAPIFSQGPDGMNASGQQRAGSVFNYKGKLAIGQAVRDMAEFGKTRPKDLASCKGWLVRILDFLFSAQCHGVVTFKNDEKILKLWLHDGCVVFSRSEPVGEDQIGRRLLVEHKITRSVLDHGLERSKELKQPIGRVLVGMGEIEPGLLNAMLRTQIVDRVLEVRGWAQGDVDVGPWVDPDVRTGLIMTSGKALVVSALREQIRLAPTPEMEKFADALADRAVLTDMSKVDPALGLTKKERRFFEKLADVKLPLRDVSKATAVVPLEAVRLFILGSAIGLLDVGAPPREKTQEERSDEAVKELTAQLEAAQKANLFEVLGLHWTCMDVEIPKAYRKKIDDLKEIKSSAGGKARSMADKLEAMVEEAFKKLANRDARKSYRQKIVSEGERQQVASHMLDQAEMLIVREDRKAAEAMLRCSEEIYVSQRTAQLYEQLRE